jgi:hypothetical protein
MTCKIVSAGAIDWCQTHNKPLTRVCRLYGKKDPLGHIPPQFNIGREG